jgi:hypothetical protein
MASSSKPEENVKSLTGKVTFELTDGPLGDFVYLETSAGKRLKIQHCKNIFS